jgi:hypothetical protein
MSAQRTRPLAWLTVLAVASLALGPRSAEAQGSDRLPGGVEHRPSAIQPEMDRMRSLDAPAPAAPAAPSLVTPPPPAAKPTKPTEPKADKPAHSSKKAKKGTGATRSIVGPEGGDSKPGGVERAPDRSGQPGQ